MSGDPFANLTDTVQDRKQREGLARKQKWIAFWASLGATVLMAVATGLGAAAGGLVVNRNPGVALDHILGGIVCGLSGGVFLFLGALWRITRQTLVNDTVGIEEDIDVGATLFWATVSGAAVFGSIGASLGLTGKGEFRTRNRRVCDRRYGGYPDSSYHAARHSTPEESHGFRLYSLSAVMRFTLEVRAHAYLPGVRTSGARRDCVSRLRLLARGRQASSRT